MRIEEDGDRVSASRQHLVFAYYVTGHGFGHATRVVEVSASVSLLINFFNGYMFINIFSSLVIMMSRFLIFVPLFG